MMPSPTLAFSQEHLSPAHSDTHPPFARCKHDCRPAAHLLRPPSARHVADQVVVTRGHFKGRAGKITSVYRKKWVIHIERLHREKANGVVAPIGFNASKVRPGCR